MKICFQYILILSFLGLWSCAPNETNDTSVPELISFKTIPAEESGLKFSNDLDDETLANPFNYINAYAGGGVAIGDINNDGLQDVYLTANMKSSKLFLNKGGMKFEDITVKAGVTTEGWSTGVSMADINNDGWLDIYVCKAYDDIPKNRSNLVFINNQDGTFSERGAILGLDDSNYSIGVSFFDYDRDGDLDCIVANHPRYRLVSFSTHINYWNNPVKEYSDRLFRNDDGVFVDVTEEAGILNYSFTLSVLTSDLNCDGWPDIFLSVDHDEPDVMFRNNGDGTFTNVVHEAFKQSTRSSMGSDVGDVNHDPFPELIVAEMLSEDHYREKANMSMQTVKRFEYLIDSVGMLYYQMRNFLHLNNGNGTFSDIGQLAGVYRTDWSWAIMFADFENDGWQDIFVGNGLYRDIFQKDRSRMLSKAMEEIENDVQMRNRLAQEFAKSQPIVKIRNYIFKNNGNLRFDDVTNDSGLTENTISSGAAYGDLDNDGDLDLVVNNISDNASLCENLSTHDNNYVRFSIMHHDSVMVLGTRIEIVADGELQTRELLSTRGFQSSSEQFLHFGLGHTDQIDKATVYWSNGKVSELSNVEINKVNEISYDSEASPYVYKALEGIVNVVPGEDLGLDFKQEENYFNDYDVQVLLPHKMSEPGQQLVVGDVNGDGLDDLFIPAPLGQANKLFIQGKDGKFESTNESVFQSSGSYEAVDAILIDIEKDGDQDIIVCAGGYQFEAGSDKYGLRLYTNDGAGNYREVDNFAPSFKSNCQSIESFDLEGDGDLDFFVGASVTPYKYPLPDKSGLFINDGDGHFNNLIGDYSSELETIGIVKDILWTDLEGDGKNELVLAGEWMPISVFTWEGNNLTNRTDVLGFSGTEGWWNTVEVSDLNNDGRLDLIGGNLGLNYKYKSSADKPFKVYSKDFDNSGSYDIVLSTYYGDEIYPVRGKSCSSEQIPSLNEKFPTFDEYAKADLFDVYGDQLDDAYKREVYDFSSCIFYNRGGKFEKSVLPINAQIAPINGIVLIDFNEDGYLDLVLAGNLYQSEIETGRADMGTGLLMLNDKNEGFNCLSVTESGMYLDGDVKDLQSLQIKNNKKEAIIVHSNKDRVRIVTFK